MSTMQEHLTNQKDFMDFLDTKANNHKYFKCYMQQSHLDSMLENKCMYLSNGKNWNDPTEYSNFNNDDKITRYGKSFSFSISESVAMWMLYGGLNNDGVMINFTQKDLKYLENYIIEVKLAKSDHNHNIIEEVLLSPEHYNLKLLDIIYVAEEENGDLTFKRSDERIKEITKEQASWVTYFKKSYPWNYENECRLIFEVDKDIAKDYNKLIIKLSDDFIDKIPSKVFKSPNYKDTNKNSTSYNPSKLSGKLEWDLCKSCKKNK